MQRHFSNRGEALAEVAAAKMMTHRTPPLKSVFPNQRGRGVTPGPWRARVPGAIFPESSPRKTKPDLVRFLPRLTWDGLGPDTDHRRLPLSLPTSPFLDNFLFAYDSEVDVLSAWFFTK
jgi:hypothetical protein